MNTRILIAAATSGILLGAAGCGCPYAESPSAASATGEKHACKGQNACKGQGNCKTDKNGCKGQNACKGQGGCKTT